MADLYTFGELMALLMAMDTDSVKTASKYQMSAAGAEANVAVAAHRLGIGSPLTSGGVSEISNRVNAFQNAIAATKL